MEIHQAQNNVGVGPFSSLQLFGCRLLTPLVSPKHTNGKLTDGLICFTTSCLGQAGVKPAWQLHAAV